MKSISIHTCCCIQLPVVATALLCLFSFACSSCAFGFIITSSSSTRSSSSGRIHSHNIITTPTPRTQQRSITRIAAAMSEGNMLQATFTLTSAAAQTAMDAACQEATANGWAVTIAIGDAGGVPILVKRCDGAFSASYEIAVGKAKTAAQFHKNTGVLEDGANVSNGSSRTALLSAPFILMRGGVPIFANEMCIGSVGVSGVKPNEDEQVAMAAVNALSSIISKL
jgi:glc operon protein GlcG